MLHTPTTDDVKSSALSHSVLYEKVVDLLKKL